MTWAEFRRHPYVIQFIKYCIGGGVFFWTGYSVFALLYSGFGLNWLVAKLIGDVAGVTANYFVQRYWAFADPRLKNMNRTIKQRYIIISATDFLIDYALVGSLKHFGVSPYFGYFISAGFFTGWNYGWYRYWVFKPAGK